MGFSLLDERSVPYDRLNSEFRLTESSKEHEIPYLEESTVPSLCSTESEPFPSETECTHIVTTQHTTFSRKRYRVNSTASISTRGESEHRHN